MDPTHLVRGPRVRTMSNTVTAPVGAVSATSFFYSIYSTRYPASTSRGSVYVDAVLLDVAATPLCGVWAMDSPIPWIVGSIHLEHHGSYGSRYLQSLAIPQIHGSGYRALLVSMILWIYG